MQTLGRIVLTLFALLLVPVGSALGMWYAVLTIPGPGPGNHHGNIWGVMGGMILGGTAGSAFAAVAIWRLWNSRRRK